MQRQYALWSRQYEASKTEDIEAMNKGYNFSDDNRPSKMIIEQKSTS